MTDSPAARPVFIAALPREIASLVSQRGWRADQKHLGRGIHLFEHADAIVACAGMGTHRASLAVEAALALGPACRLVSIGWAGACNPLYKVGDVLDAGVVIDVKTGERFFTAPVSGDEPTQDKDAQSRVLVTAPVPAGLKEKQRLGTSYGAAGVDMEAAAIARIARARELPFQAIKAISDAFDFELPDLARFTTPDGQFREAAFGFHIAFRPALWKSVADLAKGSKLAAARLQGAIQHRIGQHGNHIS